jgi:hypothetical protein
MPVCCRAGGDLRRSGVARVVINAVLVSSGRQPDDTDLAFGHTEGA